jgi:transcription termination/antitermination protein NusG
MTTDNIINDAPATNGIPSAEEAGVSPSETHVESPMSDSEETPVSDSVADDQVMGGETAENEIIGDEPEAAVPMEEPKPDVPTVDLQWYVVKVQSNREDSIKEAIERRVKIEGLQDSFGQIVIPTEKVSEMRGKKRVIRERKLLPGYLMVNVEFNEHMLYLFRETSGVGDFVGAGMNKKPIPMTPNEIKKWIRPDEGDKPSTQTQTAVSPYNEGDRVKVKDGMFAGMEGVVKTVLEAKGAVTVELTIFGRPVPVELEYWQVDFA